MPEVSLPQRAIASFSVGSIALGCMGLSHGYGQRADAAQTKTLLHAALDAGVTLFDTAALYGFGANESLVGPVLKPHRQHITLASKGGLAGEPGQQVVECGAPVLRVRCRSWRAQRG